MIRNHKFHAERIGIFRLSNGADAVIHRNDQACAAFRNFFQRPLIQPVAFRFSGRDIIIHLGAHIAQKGIQKRGCRNTVAVIIPVNGDFLAKGNRLFNSVHRAVHTG